MKNPDCYNVVGRIAALIFLAGCTTVGQVTEQRDLKQEPTEVAANPPNRPALTVVEAAKIRVDAISRPSMLVKPLEIKDVETYDALHFDPAQKDFGLIAYELSKPTWIRLRVCARQNRNLVLRTLVDWSARGMGKNSEWWDGRDASGNWIDRRLCPCFITIDEHRAEHVLHKLENCADLRLRLLRPRPEEILQDRLVVQVDFEGRKKGYIHDEGGILRAYLDYVPVGEARLTANSVGPFELECGIGSVPEGPHIITINLEDEQDHIGTASVGVIVRKDGASK